MWDDLRYAARALRKHPSFTLLATLTLALGIGANTAIFSLVNALFFRSVAGVDAPHELVGVYDVKRGHVRSNRLSYPDYLDYRDTNTAFSSLAAHAALWIYLQDGADSVELNGKAVSGDFFSTLGLVPHAGRFFLPAEDAQVDAHPVAVISHRFWQRRFHADPGTVGQALTLNGVDVTVVGIAPAGFAGLPGQPIDVWVPTALAQVREHGERDRMDRDLGWLDLVGRLAPGHTLVEARAQLTHRAARLAEALPTTHGERAVHLAQLRGIHPASVNHVVELPQRLGAAVGLMLLIVCANLAGLMTVRNALRGREIAVRLAIGAGRRRLTRQLLAEGVLLALIGGVAGLAVAALLMRFLGTFFVYSLSSLQLGLEPQVLTFALIASFLTGIAFSIMPALQASRLNVVAALKGVAGSHRSPLRAAMVVTQVALSLVLLSGAGLVLHSVDRLVVNPGFNPEGFAHFRVRPNRLGYDAAQSATYHRAVVRELSALPGVEDVALGRIPPLRGWCCARPVSVPGSDAGPPLRVENNEITPGFLDTLGIPLLAGRDFNEYDTPESPPVVIVNEALAERLWGEDSPLGRTLLLRDRPYEVVGITANTLPERAGEGPLPYYYRSFWQVGMRSSRLFVRVQGDPSAAMRPLREVLSRIDPGVHLGQEMSLAARVRLSYETERLIGQMLSAAGLVGLFLCAVGLYGAIAFAVAQRRRELGIRAALGARAADALKLILGQALRLVAIGVVLGSVVALWATRFLKSLLYGVDLGDPTTFGAVALLLTAVALLASGIPALRAMWVDPSLALRHD